jgi:hypothetical protein
MEEFIGIGPISWRECSDCGVYGYVLACDGSDIATTRITGGSGLG